MLSSDFCRKNKKFSGNFLKTLQKCKSKFWNAGIFVKKCLKIRRVYGLKIKTDLQKRRFLRRENACGQRADGSRSFGGSENFLPCRPIKKKSALRRKFSRISNGHLQFLQPLASDAFLDAFACLLPAWALLSLSAEDCLPFALDLVFSMFTPFRGCPVFRTFVLCG